MHMEHTSKPASLACSSCRSKHLKCDGREPICSRCERHGDECVFKPSLRGKRPSKRTKAHHIGYTPAGLHAGSNAAAPASVPTDERCSAVATQDFDLSPYATPVRTLESVSAVSDVDTSHQLHTYDIEDNAAVEEHLIDHYYTSFHANHPFLPSRSTNAWRQFCRPLRLAMQLVGSHYCSATSVEFWRRAAGSKVATLHGDTLQALQANLLHSMSSQADGDPAVALESLKRAVTIASTMNLWDFRLNRTTHTQPGADRMLGQTLWHLLEIDALMAAVAGRSSLIDNEPSHDTPLPQEEHGSIVEALMTLADLESHSLGFDRVSDIPSSASRVEAVTLLRRVLAVSSTPDADVDQVRAIDYRLAAWAHNLPRHKRDVINTCGTTNYTLLQAHLIIDISMIILHFPRSNLVQRNLVSLNTGLTCAPNNSVPVYSYGTHAVNAISASKAICDLATLRLPIDKLSPVFVCGLTLAAMVQLAAAHSHHEGKCLEQYKSRVILVLGVLRSLAEFYDIARRAEEQLQPAARNVFYPKTQPTGPLACGQSNDPFDPSNLFADDLWMLNLFNIAGEPANLDMGGIPPVQ